MRFDPRLPYVQHKIIYYQNWIANEFDFPLSALKCQVNEVYNPCAPYCTFDDTCPSVLGKLVIDCAPMPQNYTCPKRCECRKGFVRIGDNCVSPDQCKTI